MKKQGTEEGGMPEQADQWRLKFSGKLEKEFRTQHREDVLVQRLMLLLIGAILVACMPFLDAWILEPPEAYMEIARRVEFGLILPSLLLAFAFNADRRLRKWSDLMGLIALFTVVAGWSYLRHVGAEFDYDVPTLLIGVVLAGAFALAGLFFWAVAPVATLGLVVFATLEIWTRGPSSESLFNILAIMMLAFITALGGYLQEHRARASWWQRHRFREMSLRDGLTGLSNYRAFQDAFGALYNAAMQEKYPLLVVADDIDYFKQYNDRYGHLQGDECLRQVAGVLQQTARRSSDLCARTGGEEFTMATSVTTEREARDWLRGALEGVRRLNLPHQGHPSGRSAVVTISLGAVWVIPSPDTPPHALLRQADEQLYRAKREGRDRYCLEALTAESDVPAHGTARLRVVREQPKVA